MRILNHFYQCDRFLDIQDISVQLKLFFGQFQLSKDTVFCVFGSILNLDEKQTVPFLHKHNINIEL